MLFELLDGDAEIWIDGQSVASLPGDPWDKPKAAEISSFVTPGRTARVVIRVFKENFAAGILKPVRLMAVASRIGTDD